MEITIGGIQLKARVQSEKFEVIGLLKDRSRRCGDFVSIFTPEIVGRRTYLFLGP